jgi:hypothetical protein
MPKSRFKTGFGSLKISEIGTKKIKPTQHKLTRHQTKERACSEINAPKTAVNPQIRTQKCNCKYDRDLSVIKNAKVAKRLFIDSF